MWVMYFVKDNNDMHAPATLQTSYKLFVFELPELKFRAYNLFHGLFKRG